ncbi:prepilin-type cleavage/methylation domain-containing protein [Photobacterium sp. GB-27]|uniref:prepilin-type N-terminal cleavage/methylation domain-containing protein n=1 Tax=unclassified Photobacterium TaxID=2628852 RepID=UPI000D165184|nr:MULTISPECIES: prepilin-type N-terminal cleavage/methylation domain-containing protein [unclassified Photobacterium]PSV31656.1 prepilin-type cleavage/methylation domain-containing protein [Photobacterium sp. GB-72]PSV37582.1 prepilin-type cleavage/methylation domain-containing protein [Photobacterium sp. GB-27]PSV57605.1 prepilin-type cleavage/methylation domain-containing protein [Photobacterium sp. GB-3]
MKQQQGFTLVELIMVIVIIGIISATAAARFSGRSEFDAPLTRDQAISVIRQIQISSMQGHRTPLNVSSPCLGVCSAANSETDGSLRQSQTNTEFSLVDGGNARAKLYFNLLGQPVNATSTLVCANGCTITITAKNNQTASICINSQGYVYKKEDKEVCSK